MTHRPFRSRTPYAHDPQNARRSQLDTTARQTTRVHVDCSGSARYKRFQQLTAASLANESCASALQLQREPVEEIDVFSHFCGIKIPGRELTETTCDPFQGFEEWEKQLYGMPQTGWREVVPGPFDLPTNWEHTPRLIKSLCLLQAWVRHDHSQRAWLQLPVLLHQMKVTSEILPCLVVGHGGSRLTCSPEKSSI